RTASEAGGLAAGNVTVRFENRYRCKDGSYRWLLWTATPHPEQDLIYAAARDITDRMAAEEELHRQQQQLEAVFAATPDMITVIGPKGEITSRSHAMHELLGYDPEQFGEAAALQIVHPEDRHLTAELLEASTRGEARDIRYRARHAEGRWVTLEGKTRIVEDGEGGQAGAVVISRDV